MSFIEQLQRLSDPGFYAEIGIEPKWRIGSKAGKQNEIYPYFDADQCEYILDTLFTPAGWSCEYRQIGDHLFCTIGVFDAEKQMFIEKSDAGGSRSATKTLDQDDLDTFRSKTAASGAFVRAAAKWGIGRHLSALPKVRLEVKDYVAYTPDGQPLRGALELSAWCNATNVSVLYLMEIYKYNVALFSSNPRAKDCLSELKSFVV